MNDADFALVEPLWSEIGDKCDKLHEEWDKRNGPSTPSDYPDTREAYLAGYLQAVADMLKGVKAP